MPDTSKIHGNLSDEQKQILFNKGTEAPFSGKYLNHDEQGVYTCVNCGTELFKSGMKYESNIPGLMGWPSFAEAAKEGSVKLRPDDSHGMHRTEVICGTCDGHLWHVFDDSGSPTGQHYCINSVCLDFVPEQKDEA